MPLRSGLELDTTNGLPPDDAMDDASITLMDVWGRTEARFCILVVVDDRKEIAPDARKNATIPITVLTRCCLLFFFCFLDLVMRRSIAIELLFMVGEVDAGVELELELDEEEEVDDDFPLLLLRLLFRVIS